MQINQPVQPPSPATTTTSVPVSGPTQETGGASAAKAQLTELKQQFGEIVRAKILAIELKSASLPDSASASSPSDKRSGESIRADQLSQTAKAADLYRRNLLAQSTPPPGRISTPDGYQPAVSGTQVLNSANLNEALPKLWLISLQLAGLAKPVSTEYRATQLPAQWLPGNSLTLSIDPAVGLRVLLDGPSPLPSLRPLLQSLARFLPLQNDLRGGLQTLVTAARADPGASVVVTGQRQSPNSGHAGQLHTAPVAPAPNSSSTATAGSAPKELLSQLLARLLSAPQTTADNPVQTGNTSNTKGEQQAAVNLGNPGNASSARPFATDTSAATQMSGVAAQNGGVGIQTTQPPLPPLVKALLTVISKALLTPAQSQDPAQLKAGLQRSGMSMEAALMAGKSPAGDALPGPKTNTAEATTSNKHSNELATNIKSWLATLRISGDLSDPHTALKSPLLQELPADLKALLLTTLGATLSHLRQSPLSHQLPTNWESLVSWLMPRTASFNPATHPLEFPGQIAQASRQALSAEGFDAGEILRALAQTLARVQVNQLNVLQQNSGQSADQPAHQVWFAELPILGKQLDSVQLRLEKEPRKEGKEQRKHQWKLVLAFDFAALGPLQSHILYTDGTVSATFWADQRETLHIISEELPRLRQGLQDWGVTVGEIKVRKGHPPPPRSPVSHQLLDERV